MNSEMKKQSGFTLIERTDRGYVNSHTGEWCNTNYYN